MFSKLTFLAFIVAFIACNYSGDQPHSAGSSTQVANGWDSVNRFEFINACIEEQRVANISDTLAYSYCKCMLEQIEQRYASPDSIESIDSATLREMQQHCVK